MLESVQCQYSALWEKLAEKGQTNHMDGIDIKLLNDVIALLQPFKEASKELECEKSPTLHLVLPWKMTLLQHLTQEPNTGEASEIELLRNHIKLYMEEKFIIHKYHKVATFLWAPFRHLKMMPDNERCDVTAEVKSLMMDETFMNDDHSNLPGSSNSTTMPQPAKVMKFASWADVDDGPTPTDELERYLRQNCGMEEDIASYWRTNGQNYPKLHQIAKKVLCIQASSSASERNFSSAGFILNARRSHLHPDNVDALLFIHSNSATNYQ
ncbi:E3 SUMO-protein ligase ZBED1-like isoform X2 [Anabrus simplex]|uniref:E3 SUMO-protein ligase ZBED1-like isoform X2 n=1 Tax=Anabrus simplex TaxID=316456 RepID=UPI0035A320A4